MVAACARLLVFAVLALAACGGEGKDRSPLTARDHRTGVTFAAERARVTVSLEKEVRRVQGRLVVVACVFTGEKRNRLQTVSRGLHWPREVIEISTDMGRDVEAHASGCLLESSDGGDIAEAEFQRE